jgi:hypothetical protein
VKCRQLVTTLIISSLFLTKSQRQVRVTLEEIFNTILSFAKISHERAWTAGAVEPALEADREIRELHARFRKQIRSFMQFLRGAGVNGIGKTRWWEKEKDGDAAEELGRANARNGTGLESLLLRLEMSDYYSK